jgi:hypothetical protein
VEAAGLVEEEASEAGAEAAEVEAGHQEAGSKATLIDRIFRIDRIKNY